MAKMGMYCKAYPIGRFRAYPGWQEKAENAQVEKTESEGRAIETPRALTEDSCLFLQEDLVVTDGIFMDENIIFDAVTPEWERFCRETLEFDPPPYEVAEIAQEVAHAE